MWPFLHFVIVHFRYAKNLSFAKDFGIRKGVYAGLGVGFLFFVMFGSYALAFWYGGKLVREEEYTAGRMLIVRICFHNFHKFSVSFRRHIWQVCLLV